MEIFKYSLGIDISKDKFDCCLSYSDQVGSINSVSEKIFNNNQKGFESLLDWIRSKSRQGVPVVIVIEATGVYYENLAHFIFDNSSYNISILLPIKAKYYFKSLALKTKTDKVDAKLLSQFGLERRLPIWEPSSSNIRSLKQLSREYRDLKISINRHKNRLHAKQNAYKTNPLIIKLLKQTIKQLETQCLQLELELKILVQEDSFLSEKIDKICTIPGVRFITAINIVAETNGFKLIRNAKQLCSYAGLDVKQNISGGKSGKSVLSKRGNKYIRQAIYMPALSASKHINHLSKFYKRINEKNKCKKVGLLAVSRKLLILIYILWKKDEIFQIQSN